MKLYFEFIYQNNYITGTSYKTLTLTFNGVPLSDFPTHQVAKAFSVQCGLIYIFGLTYKPENTGKKSKEADGIHVQPTKEMQHFFEYCFLDLFKITTSNVTYKVDTKGKKTKIVRKERASNEIMKFRREVNPPEKA